LSTTGEAATRFVLGDETFVEAQFEQEFEGGADVATSADAE
jgi:hypothetical protein